MKSFKTHIAENNRKLGINKAQIDGMIERFQKDLKKGVIDKSDFEDIKDFLEIGHKNFYKNLDTHIREKIAMAFAIHVGLEQSEKILGIKYSKQMKKMYGEEVELQEARGRSKDIDLEDIHANVQYHLRSAQAEARKMQGNAPSSKIDKDYIKVRNDLRKLETILNKIKI